MSMARTPTIYDEINSINAELQASFREIDAIRREHGVKPGESLYDALGIPKWWEETPDGRD